MNDNERVEERLRRTFAQVGASTTITSRSIPPIGLDEPINQHSRLPTRRAKTVVASLVSLAVVVGAVAWITHSTPRRLNVIEGPGPSTTTRTASNLSCPLSGTAPNGETYGTIPPGGPVAKAPDFIAVLANPATRRIGGYINRTDMSHQSHPTVYGCDLTTIIGHLYPGKGVVPVGVNPETVPTVVPEEVNINALGLTVESNVAHVDFVFAEPGSPLATSLHRAGLGLGDTITRFDGSPVSSGTQLNTAAARLQPGHQVQISWTDKAGHEYTATIQT